MKKRLYLMGLSLIILALVFSAIGCEGPVGPQGIQGIQGETGAIGPQGSQGVKGDTGEPGTGTSIVWMGTATSAPKSWRVLNYAYYNSAKGASYIWDGNSWEIWARDGATGATGATGAKGATGERGPAGSDAECEDLQAQIATLEDRLDALENLPVTVIELEAGGDGTAKWTTEAYSGSCSVKLFLPNGEAKGDNAMVEIALSPPLVVSTVADWTYWAKGGGILPAMKFYIDTTEDGEADVMVLAVVPSHHSSSLPSEWGEISRGDYDGGAGIFPWYAAYNLVPGDWSKRGYGGNWDNIINGHGTYPAMGDAVLVKVAIGYTDLRGDTTSATAYIDDITIGGVLYELEP